MAVDGGISAALAEYEILGELGRGAMGVVLLARHRSLDRGVAIKQLPPALAADPGVRRRFLDEARTVAALNHPHVVVVHDFIDRNGQLALVMEQLPGGTVWDRFVSEGLTPAAATGLILSTAAGLHHAHQHGVLHRDIKPENLMLAGDGQLKVTDFGIAQMVGGDETLATSDGKIIGTPAYMAPEQAEGRALGPAADVYACGTMLFEMLTGRLPYQANSAIGMLTQRIEYPAPPVGSLMPDVPSAMAAVVDRSLQRDPADRHPTAEAMAVDLAQAAADAWGPEWLNRAGVAVRGAEAIERAARTTRRPAAHPTGPAPHAGPASRATMPLQPGREAPPDLDDLDPDELVNVREVRKRPSPWLPLLITLGLAAATAAVAMTGLGESAAADGVAGEVDMNGALLSVAAGEPYPEVDFGQPVTIAGLPADSSPAATVELRPSMFGIPLGVASAPVAAGGATVEPGYLQWTTAGRVDVEVSVVDGAQVQPIAVGRVVPTHSWITTVQAVAATLVGLLGLSLLPSNLAGFRRGRVRIGSFIGAAIAGVLVGVTAAAFGWIALGVAPGITTAVATGALGAAFGVALGETYRRFRRWWLLRGQ